MIFRKPNFGPPPKDYVAGLGRGYFICRFTFDSASGFITRAEYGPSQIGVTSVQEGQAVLQQLNSRAMGPPGLGRGRGTAALRELTGIGPLAETQIDYSENNYDEWSGYGGQLFQPAQNDREDLEADQVFERVEEYVDGRRKKKREEKFQEHQEKLLKQQSDIRGTLQEIMWDLGQFTDIKKSLAHLSREEWEGLPEAPDLVKKSKRQKLNDQQKRYAPVPDSALSSVLASAQINQFVDPNQGVQSTIGGGGGGTQTSGLMSMNLTEVGQARGQILSMQLDRASSSSASVLQQSSVNRDGFLTALNSQIVNTQSEINDLKKARALMKSVIQNNPESSAGWIAAARIEELDSNIQAARNVMAQACQQFLDNEDIWLEAARLSPPEKTKALLAKAVSLMPRSKKLWLAAAEKEQDKAAVLKKALEHIQDDVELWKEAVQQESPAEAKLLLYQAVKAIPQATELWLALAKLETYENAQTVLSSAREAIPTDHTIWISAARLEEAQGNSQLVEKIIRKAIQKLTRHNVQIKRDQWLQEAVTAEQSESLLTCKAIVKQTMEVGIDEQIEASSEQKEKEKQMRHIWVENARSCVQRGAIETARALLKCGLLKFPQKRGLWLEAIRLEEEFGTQQTLESVLKEAATTSQHPFFYLRYAKFLWKQKDDLSAAKQLLYSGVHQAESIILGLQKLERVSRDFPRASSLLKEGIQRFGESEKLRLQLVQVAREQGMQDRALQEAEGALKKFPQAFKFWLIKAQVLQQMGEIELARQTYEEALQQEVVKMNKTVWICYAKFEQSQESFTRARTLLQKARHRFPSDPDIWLHAIRLELFTDNLKISQNLLARALQECSTSGKLWALAIQMEPRATRKTRSSYALKAVNNDSDLFVAVGKVFWAESKPEKTRKWLEKAVAFDKDNGDAWAHLYRFEEEEGQGTQCLEKVREADPKHGELWQEESKRVENWSKGCDEVVKLVAKKVQLFD